jgi:hypothetical protein
MEIDDKEIEMALEALPAWKGSPNQMWQKVEGGIHHRQTKGKWVRLAWPAAAAAAVLFGVWFAKPAILPKADPLPPVAHETEPPPPGPASAPGHDGSGRMPSAYWFDQTLPIFVARTDSIVLGQVVSEQDVQSPYVDAHKDITPPPAGHPKAKNWQPPKFEPWPTKLYIVKLVRLFKGERSQTGETFLVEQRVPSKRVPHVGGGDDSFMKVGTTYLFLFSPQVERRYEGAEPVRLFEASGQVRFAVGPDGKLQVNMPIHTRYTAIRELNGLTVDQAAEQLRAALQQ